MQCCKTSPGSFILMPTPITKLCELQDVPAAAQELELLNLIRKKKANAEGSEERCRLAMQVAHEYKWMVQSLLLSFHTDDVPLITVHVIQKLCLICVVESQLSKGKFRNMTSTKIICSKRKWTSRNKKIILVEL